jgi:hypothetical protein
MIWVPVAIAAATAIAQMYNAEKARGASNKRLKEIQKEFDAIVPPDLNVNVWDDPKILNDIPETAFDTSAITPKTIEMVGEYKPEVAQYVKEQAPELAKVSAEAQTGRKAQMDALRKYSDVASMGYSPQLEAGLMEAQRQTAREAQGRQAAILQDAARRGTATSGLTMAAQMQGGADAAERMALDAQRAALAQYGAQQEALGRSASLGGQVRESEMSESQRNADVLNQFNQRSAKSFQDYLQNATEAQNQAQIRNLSEKQRIGEANITNQYESARANRDALNRARQSITQERAANRAARIGVTQNKEATKQKIYDNDMAKAAAKAGVGYARAQADQNAGRDYAQAIQGIGDTAQSAYGASQKKPEEEKKSVF